MPVRSARPTACAAALALALAAPVAEAVTCYVVMDRSDNVIYRDVVPPVDLSEAGAPAREAMRQRGEFFLFHESDICPRVEFFTGTAGNVALRLDEALAPTIRPGSPAAAPATRAPRK